MEDDGLERRDDYEDHAEEEAARKEKTIPGSFDVIAVDL